MLIVIGLDAFTLRVGDANEDGCSRAPVAVIGTSGVVTPPDAAATPTARSVVRDRPRNVRCRAAAQGRGGAVMARGVGTAKSRSANRYSWLSRTRGRDPLDTGWRWTLLGGGTQFISLVRNFGSTTYSVTVAAVQGTEFIYGDDDSVALYSIDGGRPKLAIWAYSQACECEYHSELLADGHLYISEELMIG